MQGQLAQASKLLIQEGVKMSAITFEPPFWIGQNLDLELCLNSSGLITMKCNLQINYLYPVSNMLNSSNDAPCTNQRWAPAFFQVVQVPKYPPKPNMTFDTYFWNKVVVYNCNEQIF